MAPKKTKEVPVHISLAIGSDVHEGSGENILDALVQIKRPTDYGKGLGQITVIVNGHVSKLPIKLVPIKMQRIFEKPVEMELFAKRVQTLI